MSVAVTVLQRVLNGMKRRLVLVKANAKPALFLKRKLQQRFQATAQSRLDFNRYNGLSDGNDIIDFCAARLFLAEPIMEGWMPACPVQIEHMLAYELFGHLSFVHELPAQHILCGKRVDAANIIHQPNIEKQWFENLFLCPGLQRQART